MKTTELQAITILKAKARGLQLTQQKLADMLNVSLPTVKRWWAGRGLSLNVLHRLCALMGLTLSELFAEIESFAAVYTYTLQQEQLLVSHPKILAFFDFMVSGESVQSIKRKFTLSEAEVVSMLLKLDRVGLLELH